MSQQTVYVVTYFAENWAGLITLPSQVIIKLDDTCAVLGVYRSIARAKQAAQSWAEEQFDNRLDEYEPPLETEDDRDEAREAWSITSVEPVEGVEVWECAEPEGNERLKVMIEARQVVQTAAVEFDRGGK